MNNFENKKVLLIICGGIAAYKSLELIRLFKKKNAFVKTILTKNASKFVTPLSVTSLSQEKVYTDLFNFREIRYFDIKGEYTGLLSKAMTAPDGKIRIPLNEEAVGGGGQIEEFLMQYNGEGIQHIAFACDDLPACLDKLKAQGMKFMTPPPDTYYQMLEERLPGHGEPVDELQARGILLDGTTENGEPRLLLPHCTRL